MTAVWFTSDLHIGHEKVAVDRFLPSLIDGTAAIKWHDAMLAYHWDVNVGRDDHVWLLGDLSAGGSEVTAYALNWVADRPGIKHLIAGNHDHVHPMHRDAHKWQPAYLKVFASVQPFARRRIAGRSVLLSHFPYVGDHTETDRHTQYRLRDEGEWLLHGHTHSIAKWAGWRHSRQIHVGVDAWGMRPVRIDDVAALLNEDTSE